MARKPKPKLTEQQKRSNRHAKKTAKINAKAVEQAGIFAAIPGEVRTVTQDDVYWHWRSVVAAGVEGTCTQFLGQKGLGRIMESVMRHHARQVVGDEVFALLDAYRWKTYPGDITYGYGFWRKVLTGGKIQYNARPSGQTRTNEYGTFNIVTHDTWPPPGWVPPLTDEQFYAMYPFRDPPPPDHDDGGLAASLAPFLERKP